MLMRVFVGWLRGERGHCGMVVIPTMEEEAARRPSRERESLVNERSRITNRMRVRSPVTRSRHDIQAGDHDCHVREDGRGLFENFGSARTVV